MNVNFIFINFSQFVSQCNVFYRCHGVSYGIGSLETKPLERCLNQCLCVGYSSKLLCYVLFHVTQGHSSLVWITTRCICGAQHIFMYALPSHKEIHYIGSFYRYALFNNTFKPLLDNLSIKISIFEWPREGHSTNLFFCETQRKAQMITQRQDNHFIHACCVVSGLLDSIWMTKATIENIAITNKLNIIYIHWVKITKL